MFVIRFLRTPVGTGVRIAAGLLLLIAGGASATLPGLLSMMGGVSLVVTGTADVLTAPRPRK